jgi:flagellar biosynthesis/type III secretory pathway chaperone
MSLPETSTLEDLYDVLRDEAESYRRLVLLTQRERSALHAGKLTDMETAIREKEAILASVAQQERRRELIVAHLAKERRLPAGVSLLELISDLAETVPSLNLSTSHLSGTSGKENSMLQKLKSLYQEFASLAEQLLMLNQGNRSVIQAELVRVNATFEYLSQIFKSSNERYTCRGKDHLQPNAGSVLNWQI